MELRQLEYFRVIAETESIHEAARRLNMSQPPLSYQLKQLEAELNVTLFERTREGVRLTDPASGKTWSLGDKMMITIVRADVNLGKIDFEVAPAAKA